MKLSFMTLGCPDWDLDTICARGQEYGFDGVDFRGYLDHVDVTIIPEFTTGVAETKHKLDDVGLAVSGISTSLRVCAAENRANNIEEARRTIALAHELDTHNIRVFGGGNLEDGDRKALAQVGRDCIEEILKLDGAQDLHWNFESHDLWIKGEDCKLLLDIIDNPAFGCTWDIGHTSRVGGETPAQTYSYLGERIYYTHIKDAIHDTNHEKAMKDGWRYVIPGTGQLPLAEGVALLREKGYDGWFVCEHELRWHRELDPPEVIFPAFVKWIRNL